VRSAQALSFALWAIAGCRADGLPARDLSSAAADLATRDLAMQNPEPDLAVPDLPLPHDFSVPPDLTSPADDGSVCGDGFCAHGLLCCGDSLCIDPNDPMNCGSCGNVCSSGLCGSSIVASMAVQPTDWLFNGVATWDSVDSAGALTDMSYFKAGTIIYKNPIVTDSFDVSFEFRFVRAAAMGGDGMGFMIQKTGNTAVGGVGGSLGMAGLDGFGVELDDWDNQVCGDFDSDHLAVDSLTVCSVSGFAPMPTPISVSQTLSATYNYDISDGSWRSCLIHVENGNVTVTLNQSGSNNAPALSKVALPGLVLGDQYYFGFAAATGLYFEKHEIRNAVITFPTPRCL
jgi:hypothetical protein